MRPATETLIQLYQNAEISSHIFEAPFSQVERFDLGLRMLLLPGETERYAPLLQRICRLKPNSLYHLEDAFYTHYAILKLPDEETDRWLSLGPMLIRPPSQEQILALLSALKLPESLFLQLSAYYDRLPHIRETEVFETIAQSVADTVFSGRGSYILKHIHNTAEPDALQQLIAQSDPLREESVEEHFELIRQRYALEDAFLRAVMAGDAKAALTAHYRFTQFAGSPSRMPDRLRDRKDLGITLNTLLRKAAQEAGVHPYYIDACSNANVVRLEQCSNEIQLHSLYREFVQHYCELIRQYALEPFSKPVQEAIFLIQSDLGADLSLTALAEKLDLDRSYLSTLFSREVGKPLGAYVLEKRILRAQHLLATTPLSIQEIAWEVGIPDANYFARLFKRETGSSPRSYRREQQDKKDDIMLV